MHNNLEKIAVDEQMIDSKQTEVIYKLVNEGDTLYLPLKKFCLQKNGWKYFGLVTIEKNQTDADDNETEGSDASTNTDTTNGVKGFDEKFENIPYEEETDSTEN